MVKITKVQGRVLCQMINSNTTVIVHSGRGYHSAFFRGSPEGPKPRPQTIYALKKKGLVEIITPLDMQWRSREYAITDRGRCAV